MNLPKIVADAEALAAAIKAATDAAGADGKKINPAEWGRIIKAALALLGDLVGMIPKIAA